MICVVPSFVYVCCYVTLCYHVYVSFPFVVRLRVGIRLPVPLHISLPPPTTTLRCRRYTSRTPLPPAGGDFHTVTLQSPLFVALLLSIPIVFTLFVTVVVVPFYLHRLPTRLPTTTSLPRFTTTFTLLRFGDYVADYYVPTFLVVDLLFTSFTIFGPVVPTAYGPVNSTIPVPTLPAILRLRILRFTPRTLLVSVVGLFIVVVTIPISRFGTTTCRLGGPHGTARYPYTHVHTFIVVLHDLPDLFYSRYHYHLIDSTLIGRYLVTSADTLSGRYVPLTPFVR